MMFRRCLLAAAMVLSGLTAATADIPPPEGKETVFCGFRPGDWCEGPPGDPCGVHKDTASCQADTKCYGMPYRGESVVACFLDDRGFSTNCPTVGCTFLPPVK